EPRATQQAVVARQFDALATRNTVLLAVTDAYLALAGAELRLQAIRQSERDVGVVAKQTAAFARTQEGRQGDADRARNQALLLRGITEGIEEEVAVAAAELARLLNLDPSVRVRVPGGTVPLMRLIDPHARLEDLLEVALRNRPEVAARTA